MKPPIAMSRIAMRDIMNHTKSVAISSPNRIVALRERLAHHKARIMAHSPIPPSTAEGKRQPNEVSPITSIDQAISCLATSGCSGLSRAVRSISRRAAGR